jgi:glucokinase
MNMKITGIPQIPQIFRLKSAESAESLFVFCFSVESVYACFRRTICTMTAPVLVLDVGGTKLAAGIMLPTDRLVCRAETATRAQEGAAAILARLIALGHAVLADYRRQETNPPMPAAIGLASAGYIDADSGQVLFATDNLPGWMGQNLSERLTAAFALPAFVANDAHCFTLAEAVLGAGRRYRHVLVVAVGTGVGGGSVVAGRLYTGWQGRAGAIGHLVVEPTGGRRCSCGLSGCLESYTATRIMVAESGYPSIQTLAADYAAGAAMPAVDAAAGWLGIGLASLAHTLGPEVIVVGGSVGLLGERYLAAVRQSFVAHTMPIHAITPILPALLQADSGLFGAGLLARQGCESCDDSHFAK